MLTVEQRRTRAETLRNLPRENRRTLSAPFELRDDGDGTLTLTGYASVTEAPYDMGWYTETIGRGAFAKTLAERPDVQLLLNHDGLPLARTTAGNLDLDEDDHGLRVVARLDATDPDVQTLARKTGAGLLDQMSFAFRAMRQDWNDDYTERRITETSIDRGDVSVVNYGANPSTSFTMRDALRAAGVSFDVYVAALHELRVGAALSAATMAVLQQVLDMVADADDCVDEAQAVLSDLMGVPNPDVEDEDAARAALDAETRRRSLVLLTLTAS